MAITDNGGYDKQTMAGFLGLLMAQGAASAKNKFLSLILICLLFTGCTTADFEALNKPISLGKFKIETAQSMEYAKTESANIRMENVKYAYPNSKYHATTRFKINYLEPESNIGGGYELALSDNASLFAINLHPVLNKEGIEGKKKIREAVRNIMDNYGFSHLGSTGWFGSSKYEIEVEITEYYNERYDNSLRKSKLSSMGKHMISASEMPPPESVLNKGTFIERMKYKIKLIDRTNDDKVLMEENYISKENIKIKKKENKFLSKIVSTEYIAISRLKVADTIINSFKDFTKKMIHD
jgi:hypothetical protein